MIVNGSQQVTAETEQIQDDAVNQQETLRVPGRSEPSHLPLALPRRMVRHLRSIVLVLPGTADHGGITGRRAAP